MTLGEAALAVAVPAALLAALVSSGRRFAAGGARTTSAGSTGQSAGQLTAGRAAGRGAGSPTASWWTRLVARIPGRERGARSQDFGVVCASVAARVRAGEAPARAWASELGSRRTDPVTGTEHPGVEYAAGEQPDTEHPGGVGGLPVGLVALVGRSPGADAALVATRVALRSGAPLADVLDAVSVAVAEAEAAEADRRRARAGPATTARLLGWLPLGALLLGAGLGADPIEVASRGGVGLASLVAGAGLMVLGRWWARSLVRAAERGDDPRPTSAE